MEPRPTIPVLYQDEHVLVVNKPAKTLVVAAPGRTGPTVTDRLQRQLGQRVYPVHRLDEGVTGVLVLALNPKARGELEEVFRRHQAQRSYVALLSRAPDPPAGRIESRLREDSQGRVHSVATGPGEKAITLYKTIRRVERYTLIECELWTGRRNQIRVHMADIGCPIVGDRKYGFRVHGGRSYSRPMLHALEIAFPHPVSKEEIRIRVEPGEDELLA